MASTRVMEHFLPMHSTDPEDQDVDQERDGVAVLLAGRVDGPPPGPWRPRRPYALALDVNAADGIAPGWWCQVVTFAYREGRWIYAAGESDNSTTPDPFSRPRSPANSVHGWCDWHSNGGLGGWGDDDPPPWRHTFSASRRSELLAWQ